MLGEVVVGSMPDVPAATSRQADLPHTSRLSGSSLYPHIPPMQSASTLWPLKTFPLPPAHRIRAGKERESSPGQPSRECSTDDGTAMEKSILSGVQATPDRTGSHHTCFTHSLPSRDSIACELHFTPQRELNRSSGEETLSDSSEILPHYENSIKMPGSWDDQDITPGTRQVNATVDHASPEPPFGEEPAHTGDASMSTMTSSDLFCILVWDENSTRIDAEIDPIKQVEEEINQSSVPSSPRRFGQYLTVPSPSLADLDWELRLQRQAFENSRSASSLSPAPSIRLAARQSTFECGVCGEYQPLSVQISLAECGHKYCNACLSSHVKSKIEDSRYPIFCPECLAEYSRIIRTRKLV
ncbi:hypothetical protein D9613_006948 [Agrocybe pediades]|uniref:RING-type domain-containing protein n=1 Tax=Agrocybe pediades TaxID=84607 RepID=A0A8H4QG30_9AGAR|nr:hypothetical protein D9613_006948 [Agrocybe pediades]